MGNILLDHFATAYTSEYNSVRPSLKRNDRIRYALCDFDSSFLLSPSPPGKHIQLPGELSFDIYQPKPYETSQGEPEYDPFIFDIGCLGIFFWNYFCVGLPVICTCQCLTRNLFQNDTQNFPLIVPLVDKMITWKLEERFTAEEALQFVEDHIMNGSAEILNQGLSPRDFTKDLITWDPDSHDKWVNLSPDFIAQWETYRAPKSRWCDFLLRKICTTNYWAYRLIKFFRSLYRHFRAT